MAAHASDDADAGYTMSLWENEAAMRAYESSDILQKTILPQLKPFFSGDYTKRAAKSGSLKNSIKRRVTCVVRAVLVDPRAKAGRGMDILAMICEEKDIMERSL